MEIVSEGTQQMSGLALPTFLRDSVVCDDKTVACFSNIIKLLIQAGWAGPLTGMAQAHQVAACEEAQVPRCGSQTQG